MSSFCGIIQIAEGPIDPSLIEAMSEKLNYWGAERVESVATGQCAMAHLMWATTPESVAEILPLQSDHLIISGDCRIDNRDELRPLLEIPEGAADSQFVLKAYQKWGDQCTEHLIGDFAFAIWDQKERKLFCARDQIGVKPLFYYLNRDFIAFASEIKAFFCIPGFAKEVNRERLADLLTRGPLGTIEYTEQTLYRAVYQVPPAHSIVWCGAVSKKQRYWELSTNPVSEVRDSNYYVESLRQLIAQAVLCRSRTGGVLGCELSGGLDSSLIAALGHRARSDIHMFTNTIDDGDPAFLNEAPYARQLCDYLGVRSHHLLNGESFNFDHALRDFVNALDGPIFGMGTVFRYPLIQEAAKHNCRVVLCGFGGDEGVSAVQRSVLYELARTGAWKDLFMQIKLTQKGSRIAKDFAHYVLHGNFPMLMSLYQKMRIGECRDVSIEALLHSNLSRLNVELPKSFSSYRTYYHSSVTQGFRHHLYSQICGAQSEYIRSVTSGLTTYSKRSSYVFPLLDVRVLNFIHSIPAQCRFAGRLGRSLMREVMKGLVPEELRLRKDKAGSIYPGPYKKHIELYQAAQSTKSASPSIELFTRKDQGRDAYLTRLAQRVFLYNSACNQLIESLELGRNQT